MRIAIVGTSLFGQGAEYAMASLARGLVARGHVVDVIVSHIHRDLVERGRMPFQLDGRVGLVVLHVRRARWSVPELTFLLARRRYDAVMSHANTFVLPLAIAVRLSCSGARLIKVEHLGGIGCDSHGNALATPTGRMNLVWRFVRSSLSAQFAVSTGVAEAVARFERYPRERIYVVYNPVVDDDFHRKLAVEPVLLPDDFRNRPVVMAAGAFCEIKHYDLLIRAFARIDRSLDARLVIYGDGPCRRQYEDLIGRLGLQARVLLPGFVNNLPAQLRLAACFVCTSWVESFSIVLVEALAAGVPVVSTDAPTGPSEILADGAYGRLVPRDDEDKLVEAICDVLRGGVQPVPEESWRRFSAEAVLDRYENALGEVVK